MLSEPVIAGLRERLVLLRRVNSFGRLTDHALQLLAEHARVRNFADGALALEEGRLDFVHVVASGSFVVTRLGKPIADVGAGGAIGVMSAFAQDSNGVTARAVGECRTLEVPVDIFMAVNEESFSVLRVGFRVFSRQLLDTRGHYTLERGRDPGKPAGAGEMGLIERVIELSERGLFSRWNANAIFDVARGAKQIRLRAGEPLWHAGDVAKACYHVVHGQLACREECAHGPFGAGSMLGLLETFAEQTYVHTPVAEGDCLLLEWSLDPLLAALDTHRDLAIELVAKSARALLTGEP